MDPNYLPRNSELHSRVPRLSHRVLELEAIKAETRKQKKAEKSRKQKAESIEKQKAEITKMATLSLSSTSQRNFPLYGVSSRSTTTSKFSAFQPRTAKLSCLLLRSLHRNPLRVSIGGKKEFMAMKGKSRGSGAMCYAAPLSVKSLQWISTISSAVLLLAKGTAVQKSFLVPLFLLQAPATVVSWIKGEYGIWAAFLALLVRLFFFIPGELELPLTAFLLVIVAPYQVLKLRGRQEGAIISLVIAAYLAFQHFSRIGSLERSFDRGSIIATLAIVSITALSCLFLF